MKFTKQEIWNARQEICYLLDLEKMNCVAFLGVKLLAENSRKG